jgi:hypothetical protein
MADFTYSSSTGRYRDADGKLVSFRAVRDAVDRTVDEASDRLGRLAERLRSGEITLADFQTSAMATIKDVHLATGIAAHGGKAAMDQATYGAIGYRIRSEYAYLRGMAREIADGIQPLDGRLAARARLYGQAGRATFETVRARDDVARGADEERNVLSPSEHCDQCRSLAALEWVPVGTLPPIGARTCGSNDRCSIRRRGNREIRSVA